MFRFLVNDGTAPGGLWCYRSNDMGGGSDWINAGVTWHFPSDVDAGTYTVNAARNSQGALGASASVLVVEVQSLSAGGVISTTDDPGEEETVYVEKREGGTLTISATPEPQGIWPEDYPKWSGAGTVHPNNQASCTIPLDETGVFTVTASCGNSIAIKVVVLELEHKPLAALDRLDPKRTRFGVGEKIDLSIHPKDSLPSVVEWTTTIGKLTGDAVNERIYVSPESNGSVTISVKIKNCTLSKTFTIVAPTGIFMERVPGSGIRHIKGIASTGFQAVFWIQPNDVSFSEIEIQEQQAPAITSGCYEENFGQLHPLGGWLPGLDNVWPQKGTLIEAVDFVWSGDEKKAPFSTGMFRWNIQVRYRVRGSSSEGVSFTTLYHEMYLNPLSGVTDDAWMTLSKGGIRESTKASDPSSSW